MIVAGRFVPSFLVAWYDYRCRLFAADAHCARCLSADPVVLLLGSRPLLCRRCDLFVRTGCLTEGHHLGGRPSRFLLETDPNDHVWLTAYQRCWRGRLAPGSIDAVICDVLWLIILRISAVVGRGAAA